MKEFWEEIHEIPGEEGIITKGGFRISFSRKEIERFFGVLLEKKKLEELLGETAYWLLIPSLVSIYSFPVILFISKNLLYTVLASLGLMMSMSLFNQSSYNYKINNYLVRPAVNPVPKFLINLVFAILMYRAGLGVWFLLLPFLWWILNDRIPLLYLISELIMIKVKSWMYTHADPEGVLKQVALYWAKQYNLSVSETGRILGEKVDKKSK